jgi:lipopolysaccharide export system protein LptA
MKSEYQTSKGLPRRAWLLFAAAWCLLPLCAQAASPTLVLKSAGSNENSMINGELVSVLTGNVVWLYDDVTIRSESAKWWRTQGMVEFSRNVDIHRAKQRLTCDRMNYTKKNSMLLAAGNVRFVDSLEKVIITGNQAQYNLQTRKCVLDDAPKVVRYDTSAVETLTIVGRQMTWEDSQKVVWAKDSVRIHKGDLVSLSQYAYYLTDKELVRLRVNPRITYDRQKLNGDSINLAFRDDTLRSMVVMGKGRGVYTEYGRSDTTRTTVAGDSIYMDFTDTGTLDSAWVVGNVVSRYSLMSDSLTPNQVSGKQMVLAFGDQSQVRHARLWGNAMSTYYMEDKNSKNRNDASGDTLSVWFEEGQAVRLRLSGSVRGKYFPQ